MTRFTLDNVFGVHAKALSVRSKRAEVIANNLSNVDTPGFKARDLDFKAAMSKYMDEPMKMAESNKKHFATSSEGDLFDLTFRRVNRASIDGNTVNKDVETTAYARNAVQYQASLRFLNGVITGIRRALKGE